MTKHSANELKNIAKDVRIDIVSMIHKAGSGHPAGSLSSVEILISLYFEAMEERDEKNHSGSSDKFFLSNGHICPAWYSVLAEKGIIEKRLLGTYTELGSPLQGHPERKFLPKVVMNTSGPLGLGFAQGVGFAKASKMDGKDGRIFVLTSDAEHEEGNHWEAVLLASQFKLDNLTLFVDRNRIQIESMTKDIAPIDSLKEKYESFGWNAEEIEGHNFEEIIEAIQRAKENKKQPTVIIAKTIAGKGVSFMEGKPEWHAKAPNDEEYKKAIKELNGQ